MYIPNKKIELNTTNEITVIPYFRSKVIKLQSSLPSHLHRYKPIILILGHKYFKQDTDVCLPTHHLIPNIFKEKFRKSLCEHVSLLMFGVSHVDFNLILSDHGSKPVVFDTYMFGP